MSRNKQCIRRQQLHCLRQASSRRLAPLRGIHDLFCSFSSPRSSCTFACSPFDRAVTSQCFGTRYSTRPTVGRFSQEAIVLHRCISNWLQRVRLRSSIYVCSGTKTDFHRLFGYRAYCRIDIHSSRGSSLFRLTPVVHNKEGKNGDTHEKCCRRRRTGNVGVRGRRGRTTGKGPGILKSPQNCAKGNSQFCGSKKVVHEF